MSIKLVKYTETLVIASISDVFSEDCVLPNSMPVFCKVAPSSWHYYLYNLLGDVLKAS